MAPITQNYSYALDENDNLVHIVTAERGKIYRCPHCGELMTPHMGEIRKWHFTHKANLQNCSYETYLHKIAKARIREAFLSSPQFFISYDVPVYCNRKSDCKIYTESRCTDTEIREFDLKKYYDTCEEEVAYKNFRADLMLSGPNREKDPILIEIEVSHKSSQKKREDGVSIIEVKIESEEDIDKICSQKLIEGKRPSDFYYSKDEIPKNKFINFEDKKIPTTPNKLIYKPDVYVLWVKEPGSFFGGKYLCSDNYENSIPRGAYYIISKESVNYSWAMLQIIRKRGINFKNCLICKYMKRNTDNKRLCALYKKFNLPKCPQTKYAIECPYFKMIEVPLEPIEIRKK